MGFYIHLWIICWVPSACDVSNIEYDIFCHGTSSVPGLGDAVFIYCILFVSSVCCFCAIMTLCIKLEQNSTFIHTPFSSREMSACQQKLNRGKHISVPQTWAINRFLSKMDTKPHTVSVVFPEDSDLRDWLSNKDSSTICNVSALHNITQKTSMWCTCQSQSMSDMSSVRSHVLFVINITGRQSLLWKDPVGFVLYERLKWKFYSHWTGPGLNRHAFVLCHPSCEMWFGQGCVM